MYNISIIILAKKKNYFQQAAMVKIFKDNVSKTSGHKLSKIMLW